MIKSIQESFEDPKIVSKALSVDNNKTVRFNAKITAKPGIVEVKVDAKDEVALRAGTNSAQSLIKMLKKLEDKK